MITDTAARHEEEQHIKHALQQCQYPRWAIEKGKQQVLHKNKNRKPHKPKKKDATTDNKDTITLPYIRGLTERIQRAMKKHNIHTAVKPYRNIRQLLVHPKDRIENHQKCNVIYEIPCKSCKKTYIGETGRAFTVRKHEHKKECEKETAGRLTRTEHQRAQQDNLKSAISDHCKRNNHVMDWDKSRIINQESNKYKRWIKEAIEIRKRGADTMNRDEGSFQLSRTWDSLLQRPPAGRGRGQPDRTVRLTTP
ncbi:hypothetical protein WMY93_011241 [Mugilogobius chulae]|uniref:GIY-YIG domain-containing protein n=1 Tax=Mugilogobius chulae TaxID=88201 RepID=A0AAW0P3E5_9GOBI